MKEFTTKMQGLFQDPNFITGISILAANSDPTRHWSEGFADASKQLSAMERSALNRAEMELRKQKFEQERQQMEAQRAAQEKLRTSLAGAKTPQEVGMALMTQGTGGQISTGAQLYGARGPELPASIREFEYVQGLPEDQRETYMQMQRGAPPSDYFTLTPTTTGFIRTNARTGEVVPLDESLVPISSPAGVGASAEARERGKGEAKASLEAKAAIPQLEVTQKNISDAINYIESNKNVFRMATGPLGSRLPARSTAASDMNEKLKFLESQVIPQATQQLKGLGPMSEYELESMSRSIANLNRAQSPEAYLKGAKDFLRLVEKTLKRKKSGSNESTKVTGELNNSLLDAADRIIGGGQ